MSLLLRFFLLCALVSGVAVAADSGTDALAIAAPITPDLQSIPTASAPAALETKPAPTFRQGMKFMPLDRKKMIVKPLSKNQPVIIRPTSPIVNRSKVKNKTDEDSPSPVRVGGESASTSSSNPVLSVFEPQGDPQ